MDVQSLRKRFKLMADESAMDSAAIEEICKENLADMVNIKLMKCGTLSDALLSAEILENHGISGMIGCMGETTLSIAGGLQIGFASKSILISDLDSPFMLKDDICDGLKFDDGYYRYSGRPGLGIQINLKKILQYEVEVSPSS
jgi:L-alanine-DL-glutamate epimerase-like enolase superfamily enzyme